MLDGRPLWQPTVTVDPADTEGYQLPEQVELGSRCYAYAMAADPVPNEHGADGWATCAAEPNSDLMTWQLKMYAG